MSKSRYYKILGLPNDASINDVRKQYRKLAMMYHPDRNDSKDAEQKFIEISEAYEILIGKKQAPAVRKSRAASKKQSGPNPDFAKQQEERAKQAKARFKQQQYEEHLENERYYQFLTNGLKWKTLKVSAVIGVLLSVFIIADYFLPHHYQEDRITEYSLNRQNGLDGNNVSLIKTENEDYYWIEHISYTLYGRHHNILVESSWIFHNPIQVIAKGKTENSSYPVNFNFYKVGWLLVLVFLVPAFTLYYKRRKVSFTVLFHFSYYAVNGLILVYLLTGSRWAHVLTFGML